jgi:hypothetical protein
MQRDEPPGQSGTPAAESLDMGLFLELGRQKRKEIMRLKEGTGPLTRRVQAVVNRWREQLNVDPAAEVVPVVLLYRRERSNYITISLPAAPPAGSEDTCR